MGKCEEVLRQNAIPLMRLALIEAEKSMFAAADNKNQGERAFQAEFAVRLRDAIRAANEALTSPEIER